MSKKSYKALELENLKLREALREIYDLDSEKEYEWSKNIPRDCIYAALLGHAQGIARFALGDF